jgi:hypothetical protein
MDTFSKSDPFAVLYLQVLAFPPLMYVKHHGRKKV